MKKIRIISLIILIISSFVTLELLINVLGNIMPEANDGLRIFGISSRLIFGDSLWSYERFFDAFRISALITFAFSYLNILLLIIARRKNK
ncbi:MAG: hypothetical protein IJO36_01740 [Clostridia bacterium]|nr:hypothetical protein [Clostridia bacterium]